MIAIQIGGGPGASDQGQPWNLGISELVSEST